eukprot:Opistho-1_new@38176
MAGRSAVAWRPLSHTVCRTESATTLGTPGAASSRIAAMPTAIPLRPQHQEELLLKHLRAFLDILDEDALQRVRQRLRWVEVPGGETLMRQGEPGDALYLLVSGRLRVYIEENEQRRIVREIARGEV